jgi:hypothetical protein
VSFKVTSTLPTYNFGRVMVFGHTGAGKSTLGSTMPGNIFVLSADPNAAAPLHRGFSEVPRAYTPPSKKDRVPKYYGEVKTWDDVASAVEWLEANHSKLGIESVVVDSLTAISEMIQNEIGQSKGASLHAISRMTKPDFGTLFLRLDNLRQRMHQLPVHILWICGAKQISTSQDEKAPRYWGPDIVGQSAERFPSQCLASLFIERKKGASILRTKPDDEVYAKDNTGLLPSVCVADMELILNKMGMYNPSYASSPEFKAALERLNTQGATSTPAGKSVVIQKKVQ